MSTKGVTEYRTARTTERKDKAWRARDYAVQNSKRPRSDPGKLKTHISPAGSDPRKLNRVYIAFT